MSTLKVDTIQDRAGAQKGTLRAGTPLVKSPVALNSTTTQAHGLGAEPTFYKMILECLTADAGYSPGDRVVVKSEATTDGATPSGAIIFADATNVNLNITTGQVLVLNKTTRAITAITVANWKYVVTPYLVN